MAAETVQAFFLHKRLSGETSLRVRFFTNEHGIVDALYKGGRSLKKQLHLQSFTQLRVSLDVRRDWYYVRELECESTSISLVGDALFSGLYLNELLYSMLKPHDPSPRLFSAYITALNSLVKAPDRLSIEPILRRFEQVLLSTSGYEISLTHDAGGDRLIDASLSYQFVAGTGFIVAKEGISGAHILAFSDNQLDSHDVLQVAKFIMRKAINHAMEGKTIHSRTFYTRP